MWQMARTGERRRRACLAWPWAPPEEHSGRRPELGQDPSTSQARGAGGGPSSLGGAGEGQEPDMHFLPRERRPPWGDAGTGPEQRADFGY